MKPAEQYHIQRLTEKLKARPRTVKWWDLVSDLRIRHTAADREQMLQIGTLGHQASLSDVFRDWQRPWFFRTVLKTGILLVAACFALVYGCSLLLNTTTQVVVQMLLLIPPMVIPIVLMIFFWELNVPRNLSIWELISFFLVGTLLTLGGNALMSVLVKTGGPMAALREEPAKLLAGILLLLYFSKVKGKYVCALTGLVIGAAIGSGFSAFETISYGLQYDVSTMMVRICFAIVGHTLYSCSYLAALALHAPGGRITLRSFCNRDFLLTFGCSVFCHGLWNASEIPLWLRFLITLFLLWYSALCITRKALLELLPGNSIPANEAVKQNTAEAHISLRCLRGKAVGKTWTYPADQTVTIGRSESNLICLPKEVKGISRTHCYLEAQKEGWVVTDIHSSYGTYLQIPGESMYKLTPGKHYPLTGGMLLYLGSRNFCFGISFFDTTTKGEEKE